MGQQQNGVARGDVLPHLLRLGGYMGLVHQLATALQQASLEVAEHGTDPRMQEWQSLIQKVQDLDSVMYLPAKCKAAGCSDGLHICDQGETYERITVEAVKGLFPDNTAVGPLKAAEIIRYAIASALGDVEISEERKVIYARLDEIMGLVDKAFKQSFGVNRDYKMALPNGDILRLDEVLWLHSVATKCLSLYVKEQTRAWCMTHRKQMQYCSECANEVRQKALRDLASAVKKVCTPEVVQAIIASAQLHDAVEALQGASDGPTGVAF